MHRRVLSPEVWSVPFTFPIPLTRSAGKQVMRCPWICVLHENISYVTWTRRDKPQSRSYRQVPTYGGPESALRHAWCYAARQERGRLNRGWVATGFRSLLCPLM